MKKTSGSMILATLAVAGVVGSASAQSCAGLPTGNGQGTLGVSAQFPAGADFGDILGFEASYNDPGPVSVFGGLTVVDNEPNDAVNFYTAGFAVELLSVAASIGPNVSVCPQTALTYSTIEGVGSLFSIPVGFGIGTTVMGSSGIGVSPYAVPQFIISRASASGVGPGGDETITDTAFGIAGGLILSYDRLWVGGTVTHVFQEHADPVVGLRAGIRL